MRTMLVLLAMALIAGADGAGAQVWNEIGDAGQLPATAQLIIGGGVLTRINGSLVTNDADMYGIVIFDPGAFSATTCGVSTFDSQLCLFAENGNGLTFNDDDPGGCGLQSTITGIYVPGPGHYFLAVSRYDYDPLNGAGLEIWADSPFGSERPPDGPGAPGPVAGWGSTGSSVGPYSITLTGAYYWDLTPTVEATWSTIKGLY